MLQTAKENESTCERTGLHIQPQKKEKKNDGLESGDGEKRV